jgi:hypothetical protein
MYHPLKLALFTKAETRRLKHLLRGYRNLPRTVMISGTWGGGMTTIARLLQRGVACL